MEFINAYYINSGLKNYGHTETNIKDEYNLRWFEVTIENLKNSNKLPNSG